MSHTRSESTKSHKRLPDPPLPQKKPQAQSRTKSTAQSPYFRNFSPGDISPERPVFPLAVRLLGL